MPTLQVDENTTQRDTTVTHLDKIMKILGVLLIVLIAGTILMTSYVVLWYRVASPVIKDNLTAYNYATEPNWYVFQNEHTQSQKAIVLYPKMKVEEQAYFYLASILQQKGYDVFVMKVFLKQYFVGENQLQNLMQDRKYEHWYVGAHGNGSIALDKYIKTEMNIAGVFYLGEMPSDHMIKKNIPICVVVGSQDSNGVNKVETYLAATPANSNLEAYIYHGGNHTNFGYYRLDRNDLQATSSAKKQQDFVAEKINIFIGG